MIAVGNDTQFRRFCAALGLEGLADDPRFATNPARLANREALLPDIQAALAARSTEEVVAALEAAKVPVGPVQTIDQVFASDQVAARDMQIDMPREGTEPLRLIGNPLKFSQTPVSYRLRPPHFGADTETVLSADDPFAK